MRFLIGVLLVILSDQISKIWVQNNLNVMESIPVIRGIFHITYIQNPYSAFGLLKFHNAIFVIIALLVILIVIFFLRDRIAEKNKLVFFSLIFLLGGSLGNIIDRLRVGSVIDFLDFRIWPIFNIADSAINIGLFLLVVHFLFHKEEKQEDELD